MLTLIGWLSRPTALYVPTMPLPMQYCSSPARQFSHSRQESTKQPTPTGAQATTLAQVAAMTQYDLMPNYADNFTDKFENNVESVFEVQFADEDQLSQGVAGLNIARMVGACRGAAGVDPAEQRVDHALDHRPPEAGADDGRDADVPGDRAAGQDAVEGGPGRGRGAHHARARSPSTITGSVSSTSPPAARRSSSRIRRGGTSSSTATGSRWSATRPCSSRSKARWRRISQRQL